jgi:hypothetical protein
MIYQTLAVLGFGAASHAKHLRKVAQLDPPLRITCGLQLSPLSMNRQFHSADLDVRLDVS